MGGTPTAERGQAWRVVQGCSAWETLPPGITWQSLETAWVVTLGRKSYRHPGDQGWGCC